MTRKMSKAHHTFLLADAEEAFVNLKMAEPPFNIAKRFKKWKILS
jgi:hypothetical protein